MNRLADRLITVGLAAHAFFAPVSIAGTQIALAVCALGLVLRGARPHRTPLDLPLALFVALAIASDVLSPYGPPTLAFATLWRAALGFYVVCYAAPGRRVPALVALAAGLGLASLVGLVQYRTGLDVVHALHLRREAAWVDAPGVPGRFGAMGFFTSRLSFGHCASVALALLAGSLGQLPRRARVPVLASCALGFAAVLATFDRAAWLGLLAAALVLVLFSQRRRVMLLAAGAGALLAALLPPVRSRFESAFSASGNADRVFLWSRAREIISDHPLRGIGFANYPRVCPAYYDRVDPTFFMRTWAHNTGLSMLAETGPLGLLALLWVFGAAARAALRRRAPGALAALAAFAVIAQFHDVFYDTKVMYPLWLALGLALAREPSPAGATATRA